MNQVRAFLAQFLPFLKKDVVTITKTFTRTVSELETLMHQNNKRLDTLRKQVAKTEAKIAVTAEENEEAFRVAENIKTLLK